MVYYTPNYELYIPQHSGIGRTPCTTLVLCVAIVCGSVDTVVVS